MTLKELQALRLPTRQKYPASPDQIKRLIRIGDMLAVRVPDYPDGKNAEIVRLWLKVSGEVEQ